mmetsp:Transcript_11339/g.31645  ORF Transcript_11339/g.31645 Transcript_11339/m.31645 type:complete len:259 (-) Transcript_11339:44-820(-)
MIQTRSKTAGKSAASTPAKPASGGRATSMQKSADSCRLGTKSPAHIMGEACDELVSSIHMDIDKCKIGPAAHPQSPPCSPRSCGANHRTVAPDPGDSVSSWRNFFDHDSTLETDDQIIIYGNSKTSWRTAASVAHFVGDTCMSLARRGRLSALSAVGLYFIAVNLCVIVTIHTGLFAASFAGSSVLWILGSSVYVRLVALAAGIGGCLVAPTREGSRMSDVQEAVRQVASWLRRLMAAAIEVISCRLTRPSSTRCWSG